jgi:hypothetical protein
MPWLVGRGLGPFSRVEPILPKGIFFLSHVIFFSNSTSTMYLARGAMVTQLIALFPIIGLTFNSHVVPFFSTFFHKVFIIFYLKLYYSQFFVPIL